MARLPGKKLRKLGLGTKIESIGKKGAQKKSSARRHMKSRMSGSSATKSSPSSDRSRSVKRKTKTISRSPATKKKTKLDTKNMLTKSKSYGRSITSISPTPKRMTVMKR